MKKIRVNIAFQFFTVLIIAAAICNCGHQAEDSGADIIKGETGASLDEALTPILEKALQSYDLPGLAVGVVKDNYVIYARGFGYKNIESKKPITTTTLFHMASISKPLVATAVMQLVEQGKIDLEAPVTTYLPYFKLDDERYKEITIQHMLSHISGMPDVMDYEWDKPQYDEGALERYVRSLTGKKMRSVPGERYAYSNMAFECLGDVIAKVSGMSFADYEKKYILDPVGMRKSTFLKPEYLPDDWAAGHLRTIKTFAWEGYPYNRIHGPSSTLHSNAVEMCRWAITNMKRGVYNGGKILEPESYDQLWKPWFKIGEDGSGGAVGLSWFLREYRGEQTISHSGGDVGFSTNLVMLPEKAIAVVVLCNYIPAPVGELTYAVLDVVLGFEPKAFIPPASIPVLRAYVDKGLEEAVSLWNSLNQDHAEEYNFNPRQLFSLAATAMEQNRAQDGEAVAKLLMEILPDSSIKSLGAYIRYYTKNHPDNQAAARMMEIIEK